MGTVNYQEENLFTKDLNEEKISKEEIENNDFESDSKSPEGE